MNTRGEFTVCVEFAGARVVVIVQGKLDLSTGRELGAILTALVRGGHLYVVLDLAGCEFIDASGLRVIAEGSESLDLRGGGLTLRSPSSVVRRMADLAGWAGIASVVEPETAAEISSTAERAHEMSRDRVVLEDRARIAADLNDKVIQRLFATALSLQGVLRVLPRSEATQRIETAIADMDDTIRKIRTTVFDLQSSDSIRPGLRAEILAVTSEAAASLGFEPRLRFDGPIDSATTDQVATALLAALREELSSVVRPVGQVDITVTVTDGVLSVLVRADGLGPGAGEQPEEQGRADCLSHLTSSADP